MNPEVTRSSVPYQHIDAIRIGLVHLQGGSGNWMQGSYAARKGPASVNSALEAFAAAVDSGDTSVCSTCMLGAAHLGHFIKNPSTDDYLSAEIEHLMEDANRRIGGRSVAHFNDYCERTYEQALSRYEAIYHNILDHYGIPRDWYKEGTPCSA